MEQKTDRRAPPPVRDRDRLRDAFATLREAGFFSRSNQSDGWNAMPVDILRHVKPLVFWHANETAIAFDDFGDLLRPLHLHHFARDADQIQRAMVKHGLSAMVEDDQIVVVYPAEA